MSSDNIQQFGSDRSKNGPSHIDRRQYLAATALFGASTLIPTTVAASQSASETELFRDTVEDGGATAAVSESGTIVAFGVYGGRVQAYIAPDGESGVYEMTEFVLPDVSPGFAVLRIELNEASNQIVAASIDDDTFGGGSLEPGATTDAEWAYEFPGLWDIETSTDLGTVAAVSYPLTGPGGVGVVRNGDLAWEHPFEDAAAWAVDVSDDGQYVAVGCIRMDEGLERVGQPGVRLFSGDGDLLWSHDTDEDVISIGVNENSNTVVAGLDDLSTLAFDLEGNQRWEHSEAPAMETLSDDGSTVIASPPVVALNASDGSTIWESDVSNAPGLGDPVSSSADGSRAAISTIDFELLVLEDGDSIWEGENQAGPYYSAISSDGSTLAAMEVDNDAQAADLVGYSL